MEGRAAVDGGGSVVVLRCREGHVIAAGTGDDDVPGAGSAEGVVVDAAAYGRAQGYRSVVVEGEPGALPSGVQVDVDRLCRARHEDPVCGAVAPLDVGALDVGAALVEVVGDGPPVQCGVAQ